MGRARVIPVLLLRGESLVKTRTFGKFEYIGDPCNTVRIFNELEVDELIFLDITATPERRGPNLELLRDIATECFMPLGYGGGIKTLEEARSVFTAGFEKVAVNSAAHQNPKLITTIAEIYGSQAVIASIDVLRSYWGGEKIVFAAGKRSTHVDVTHWAREMESRGAGEILLTAVHREGTWQGFDLDLIQRVTDAVTIPVIAHGGASGLQDIRAAVKQARASAVALGSLVVFQKKGMGVLVNFPSPAELKECLQ